MNTHIWLWKYAYLMMLGYGRDESAPTPDGVFAPHFVGERYIISNPSAAFSQTVRSRRGPIYRARIYVYTHKMTNGNVCVMMWKCVFNNVKTRI
ncbi:MAG: hypothetical protein HXN64_10150 [Prevotella pallens]|nr:hypothetical protein [Prevotella pallens]